MSNQTVVRLNRNDLNKSIYVLNVTKHHWVNKIIAVLNGRDPMNVQAIELALNKKFGYIPQPEVTRYLNLMKSAGLVNFCREGKFVFHSLNYDKLYRIAKAVTKFSSYNPR